MDRARGQGSRARLICQRSDLVINDVMSELFQANKAAIDRLTREGLIKKDAEAT